MSQQQFLVKFPHPLGIKAFPIADEDSQNGGLITKKKLKELISGNLPNEIDINCLSLYNTLSNNYFSFNSMRDENETVPINTQTTLDIKFRLCGGGNMPSSGEKEQVNPSQIVKIVQNTDRSVSSDVKSKIVFDPDTVPESDCNQIPIHEFVGGKWVVKTSKLTGVNTSLTSFKVVTFNVWFDLQDREDRMLKIMDICKECNTDIICLQEMTKGTLEIMNSLPYVRDNFYISDSVEFGNKTVMPYGVSIFIRKSMPMTRMFMNRLPTNMSRWAMSVELNLNGELMCFTTVHLESLNNQSLRAQQLYLISSFSKLYPTSFVCGDFNFDSEQNFRRNITPLENENLPNFFPEYIDIWQELKYPNLGKTHGDGSRYDRTILKSSSLQATDIDILGAEPFKTKEVKSGTVDVFPSDHCGLVVTLSRK